MVGSAHGSISSIFSKVQAIDKKHGKFDLLLCVGDFFSVSEEVTVEEDSKDEMEALLNGTIEGMPTCLVLRHSAHALCFKVPLKTYLIHGQQPLPTAIVEKAAASGGQICSNLFLLGQF